MSLFDFFKKKELQIIAELTAKEESPNSQVEQLSCYQGILDIDTAIQDRNADYS